MGRAGRGGGGGGGFRSSGFGGSRGFGSHSGGSSSHRSGFSSSSSSHRSGSSYHSHSSGGYHHHYNSGPRFYYFGGTRYSSGSYSGGYTNTSSTKKSGRPIGKIIWLAIMLIIMASVLLPDDYGSSGSGTTISKSTVKRTKLEGSSLVVTDYWYCDELGWITDPKTLKNGMEKFFDKTGVQPFLYITDDIGTSGFATDSQLEAYGNKLYEHYFEDEAHLLVVFYEKNEQYRSFYIVGKEAKTVVDDEAGDILLDYIDHYYYSSYDESEFFARSFAEAAERIMRVTPSYAGIIAVFIVIAVIVIVLFKWWKKKKQHKLDEMKQAKDILDSDLNEFGSSAYTGTQSDSYVDELKKKYDNQ